MANELRVSAHPTDASWWTLGRVGWVRERRERESKVLLLFVPEWKDTDTEKERSREV